MRFITLLHQPKQLPPYTDSKQESEAVALAKRNKQRSENDYECYDKTLYNKYMLLTNLYRNNKTFRYNYRKIINIVHPFERITKMITSKWIPNCQPIKATNAYMKLYECMLYLDKEFNYFSKFTDVVNLFDIAGAPGMFVLAMEQYLNKYHPSIKLNWSTCSLEGGTALKDDYNLYKSNPERYTPCDVMNTKDLQRIIDKTVKYDMVLGDIGIFHENDYDHLQEENQLDIEWGQMILGLNLVNKGSMMLLKMYSLTSWQTILLVDILAYHFENVYLIKPFTSRIFNAESYILCMNKNNINPSDLPLSRPSIGPYPSVNLSLISSFEYARNDIKVSIAKASISAVLTSKQQHNNTKSWSNVKSFVNEFDKLVLNNYLETLNPMLSILS